MIIGSADLTGNLAIVILPCDYCMLLIAESSCVSKRVTLEVKVEVITENHRALDVDLKWEPEQEMILVNYHKNQNILEESSVSTQVNS